MKNKETFKENLLKFASLYKDNTLPRYNGNENSGKVVKKSIHETITEYAAASLNYGSVVLTPEQQYLNLGRRIIEEGVMIANKRTGVGCLTVINADMVYDASIDTPPLLSTRKVPLKGGVGEFIGYLKGFTSAAQFRSVGSNTWNANANENKAWLNNPNRLGDDDCGKIYGAQARNWVNQYGESFDLLKQVISDLKAGIDNRGEIVTFWNPSEFEYGCLRPCMHSHQFSLLDGVLYLNTTQRSADLPLGVCSNMLQCYLFLRLMAQVTGHKPGKVYHKIVNAHIYENQIELFKEQLTRTPEPITAKFWLNPEIQNLSDIENMSQEDVKVVGYESSYPSIRFPFSV